MSNQKLNRLFLWIMVIPAVVAVLLLILMGGWDVSKLFPPGAPILDSTPDTRLMGNLPPPQLTLVTFQVEVPADTPNSDIVYLTILDEVTGLAWNTELHQMEAVSASAVNNARRKYTYTLPVQIGSLIHYRYERQSGALRLAEHLSDGSAVRYRLYHATNEGGVKDVVSRWTDTAFTLPAGRLTGQALDAASGLPIPNLLVAAGGAQTLTHSDGSYTIEGLPPGTHNVVVYATDGAYQTFQQGALIAEGSTTPTPVRLNRSQIVNLVFLVRVPQDTPPVVPLRIAGNLEQLGNTFSDLSGGTSTLAMNMPVMEPLPDGRYQLTLSLPVGADIRYKYTLGDGFWNAEQNPDGSFRIRQFIVPDQTALIEDTIETWYSGKPHSLTFDLQVPTDTPAEDFVAIQFNPALGWTSVVPMWKLGEKRWGYVLYGPLDLPSLNYRYCRNGQCGMADDVQTAGADTPGRTAQVDGESHTYQDQVNAWEYWSGGESAVLPGDEIAARGPDYTVAIQLTKVYDPSWKTLIQPSLDKIQKMWVNWTILSPTWSYGPVSGVNQLPILAPAPGKDATWNELVSQVGTIQANRMNAALYPAVNFPIDPSEWWISATRDASWWQVWFEQYRGFALHHADLARQTGAKSLILGGSWLSPALPGGLLPDGSPSQLPADAELQWRVLMGDIRQHFNGNLVWAIAHTTISTPPPFLDAVDSLYVEVRVPPGQDLETQLGSSIETWLDGQLLVLQSSQGKPLTLAASCPSAPDLQVQVDCLSSLFRAAVQRDWISGISAQDFYPPVALQDPSASVHGKPASTLLTQWYQQVLALP